MPLSKRRDVAVLKSQLGELLTTDSADAGMLMAGFCMPPVPSCLSVSALSLIAGKGRGLLGSCVQSSRDSSPGNFLLARIGYQGEEDVCTIEACRQHNCAGRKPCVLS